MLRIRKVRLWPTALLLGAPFLLRLLCLLELRGDPVFRLLVVDARSYHEMAMQIAAGVFRFQEPFWQPPFYPYLLGLLYKLAGPNPEAARLFQALLGSFSCLLLFRLAGRLFGRRAAWISWGIAAGYGPLLYFDLQILNAGLATFLLLLSLERLTASRSRLDAAAGGLALGLASITVATLLVLVPVAGVWLLFRSRHPAPLGGKASGRRNGLSASVPLFLAGALLPAAIVTGANGFVSGHAIVISYNGGVNFWIGNNPDYEHTVAIRPGRAWTALVNEPLRAGAAGPAQSSAWFFHKALDWMGSHTGDWLRLMLYKLRLLLRGDEIARNQEIYPFRGSSWVLRLLLWIHGLAFPFGWLLPLGAAGMVSVLRRGESPTEPAQGPDSRPGPSVARRPGAGLIALLAAACSLAVVCFFVTSRYRLPVVPLLVLFAGGGIASWSSDLRRRDVRRLLPPVGTLLVLGFVANTGLPAMPSRFNSDTYSDLGMSYQGQGRMEEARRQYETALGLDPRNMEAAHNLGTVALQARRLDEAASLFRRVLEAYPEDPKALTNLGTVYFYRQDPYRAGQYYSMAYTSDPQAPGAAENLRGLESLVTRLEAEGMKTGPDAFLRRLESQYRQDTTNAFLFTRLVSLLKSRGLPDRAEDLVRPRGAPQGSPP